jgi:hypothetical protein
MGFPDKLPPLVAQKEWAPHDGREVEFCISEFGGTELYHAGLCRKEQTLGLRLFFFE